MWEEGGRCFMAFASFLQMDHKVEKMCNSQCASEKYMVQR